MTLTDRISARFSKITKIIYEDPIRYPVGSFLVPMLLLSSLLWVFGSAIGVAATSPLVIKPFGAFIIAVVFLGLSWGVFFAAPSVYRWRREFAIRQPKLYRVGQIWRGALALFFGLVVAYAFSTGVAMPQTLVGPIPVWIFYLTTLSIPAIISLSTTTAVHILSVIYRYGGGGKSGLPS